MKRSAERIWRRLAAWMNPYKYCPFVSRLEPLGLDEPRPDHAQFRLAGSGRRPGVTQVLRVPRLYPSNICGERLREYRQVMRLSRVCLPVAFTSALRRGRYATKRRR